MLVILFHSKCIIPVARDGWKEGEGFDLMGHSCARLVLVAAHGASQHWMVLVDPEKW